MNILYIFFVYFMAHFSYVYCNLKYVTEYDFKMKSGLDTPDINKIQKVKASLWRLGIVTYYLDTISYDDIIAKRIYSVMDAVQRASCVQFNHVMTKPDNITWLHITNPHKIRDCVHKQNKFDDQETTLVLGYDCLKERDILHALLHAIGLKDEVTHPNRDHFIRVIWKNIRPEYRQLYQMQKLDSSKNLAEYDPASIMHFHDRAFSSNGQATIVPLITGLMIAPSDHLSQLDTMKLRLLFEHECNKRKVSDVIDTCKNALNAKRKESVIAMAKAVENPDENGSHINEATNERPLDKNNQEKVLSKTYEKNSQSYEKEINDVSDMGKSDKSSALDDRMDSDTREETTVKNTLRVKKNKELRNRKKSNTAVPTLHSFISNKSNGRIINNKSKVKSLNSFSFKYKNHYESLHLKGNHT